MTKKKKVNNPCPECGSEVALHSAMSISSDVKGYAYIKCTKCGWETKDCIFPQAAWNEYEKQCAK